MRKIAKRKTIILDIDGVMLSWHSQIIPFLKSRKVKIFKEVFEAVYRGIFFDLDMLNNLVPNFLIEYHSSKYGSKFYPLDARIQSVLTDLKEKYDLQFIALTSFGNDPIMKKNRIKNINNYFPKLFDEIIVLPALACKKESLTQLNSKYDIQLFVDDSQKNYVDAVSVLSMKKSFFFKKQLDWDQLFFIIDEIGQAQ